MLSSRTRTTAGIRPNAMVSAVGVLVYSIAVLRVAWVSDDGFISARVAANVVRGLGLVSNAGERVQGFTNPLWTLFLVPLLSAGFSAFWAQLLLGLAASAGFALVLVWRGRRHPVRVCVALWLASFSLAFSEFSTSGLENPLSHLLLCLFSFDLLQRGAGTRRTWLLAGLVGVNRLDHLFVVLPALAGAIAASRRSAHRTRGTARETRGLLVPAVVGGFPLVSWEVFSVIYYGFPLPNTAYAKLTTSIATSELVKRGAVYLADAITLALVAAAAILLFSVGSLEAVGLAAGIVMYLVVVVRVGSDFMAGRFLTPLFAVSLVAVVIHGDRFRFSPQTLPLLAPLVALTPLFPGPFGPLRVYDCRKSESGVVDERQCYAEHTALFENLTADRYKVTRPRAA